jgi:hypothetical protein
VVARARGQRTNEQDALARRPARSATIVRVRVLELSLLVLVLVAQCLTPVADTRAQAPAPPLQLTWSAPPGCPGAQHVRSLLRRQTLPRGLTITGAITREADGFLLTLEILGGPTRVVRELRTRDCAVLAQSAAWLIELATSEARKPGDAARARAAGAGDGVESRDAGNTGATANNRDVSGAGQPRHSSAADSAREGPDAMAGGAPDDGARDAPEDSLPADSRSGGGDSVPPAAARAQPSEPPPTRPTAPAAQAAASGAPAPRAADRDADDPTRDGEPAAHARGPALHGRVGAALGAMALGLGGAAPELSVDLGVSSAALDFDLRLGAVLHPSRALSSTARLSLRSYYASLSACKEWRLAPGLLLGPCGLASGLLSIADGQGLVAGRERSAFWASLGAAARLRWQLPAGVVLMFEAGLMVPISQRPSFEVTGATTENGALLLGFARFGGAFGIW